MNSKPKQVDSSRQQYYGNLQSSNYIYPTTDDTYARKQDMGNALADRLADSRNWQYNRDLMDNEGSHRERGIDTDLRMVGGDRMLDDLNAYEKQFKDIYNRATAYQNKLTQMINNQEGGAKNDQTISPVAIISSVAKKLKNSNNYPTIVWKDFIKIAKYIVDDARKNNNTLEYNETVKQTALQLADRPDKYISQFEKNNRTDSQIRPKNNKNNRTDSQTRSKSNRQSNKSTTTAPWQGTNSNYRNFAQSNLWTDNTLRKQPKLNRYGELN